MKLDLPLHGRRLGRLLRPVARWGYYLGAAMLVLLAVFYTVARLWFPQVEAKKAEIEAYLSQRTAHDVRIDKLTTYWDGLLPAIAAHGLQIAARGQPPAIRLAELHATVALLPLLWREVDIRRLTLAGPKLTLERLADGRLRVSGIDATADESPGASQAVIDWLLRQRQLSVHDGEILWRDRRYGTEQMHLRAVQFDLRNRGDSHRAGLRAQFPAVLCGDCTLAFDIDGNPFAGDDWDGAIYLRAAAFDVTALPSILRERLPPEVRGKFDVELWSDWKQGAPRKVNGRLAVADLRLPLKGLTPPLQVATASGAIHWRGDGDDWRLELTQLMLGLDGPAWRADRLRLRRDDDEHALEIAHVELADVSRFVSRLAAAHPWLQQWAVLEPVGAIDRLRLDVRGALNAPAAYRLRAQLTNVAWAAHDPLPGLQGLSGALDANQERGELRLEAQATRLDMPRVFRVPLYSQRAQGVVTWRKTPQAWQVDGKQLKLSSADGSGTGELRLTLPHDKTQSPQLRLHVDFKDGDGRQAAKYYPAPHLPPRVLAWMDQAFLGGTVTKGHVIFDGPVRAFPFDGGEGRFEVRGHVRDGVYRYLRGWAPITHADVDITVTGRDVFVTGRGRIGALDISQVVVQTQPEGDAKSRTVHVVGQVQGPVAESLRVLREVEQEAEAAGGWRGYLPVAATGNGRLRLELTVPLKTPGVEFIADYQTERASLRLATPAVSIDDLTGSVRVSRRGVEAGDLRGRLLGGPVTVTAKRVADDRLTVEADGKLDGRQVARLYSEALGQRLHGTADWTLRWRQGPALGDGRFEMALDRLHKSLPPPLDGGEKFDASKLILRTDADQPTLTLEAGRWLRARLALAPQQGGWRLARGHIGVNVPRVALPRDEGLHVSAILDGVDVDQWSSLLPPATGGTPGHLKSVRAEIKRLRMFERDWGRLYLELTPSAASWQALLEGDAAAGRARYTPATNASPAAAVLDLAYLKLPKGGASAKPSTVDPKRLPAVELKTAALTYAGRPIGQVDFQATPFAQGWRIARLDVTRPEARFSSRGTWNGGGDRHTTNVEMEFTTTDMGATLDAFGAAGQMKRGKTDVRANLTWAGPPMAPRVALLDGQIELAAEKGQFLRVAPGAARLFGLLDLHAIARYLTLDFSSVFGKGFAFDQIHGHIAIEQGNAYTRDLLIKGPSAGLAIEGRVGLAAEDYDLTLAVTPKFSDTLTLTSWGLFGPHAAAAILALQKIFKKQIAAGTRVTYIVKGLWDKPVVTKFEREKEPAAEPEPAAAGE